MPRRRSRAKDQIEQDFLDAIDRLKAGRPQDPGLRLRVKNGRPVKINILTVAKEAGRARGLIASEGCAYPHVRQRVLVETSGASVSPRNSGEVIDSLRKQVAEARVEIAHFRSHAAEHLKARQEAEARLAQFRDRFDLLSKELARTRGTGKVVSLRPREGDI